MKKTLKNNSAFTLIELLVVMVIIGILVVAGLSGLNFAQRAARDTARVADTRSVLIYVQDYYRQYKQYPGELNVAAGVVTANDPINGAAYGTGIKPSVAGLNAADVCGTTTAENWQIQYVGNLQTFDLYACQESGTKSQNLSTTPNP